MPIPGHVIGDSSVEDSNELANIILDSLTLLDLLNSPFLVILSSSFFNIHTFDTSDLNRFLNLIVMFNLKVLIYLQILLSIF